MMDSQLPQFYEALEFRTTSGIPMPLTTFQVWTFNIISLLSDLIIIALSVGVIGYYIKELKVFLALLYGLLLRYFGILILFLYKRGQISSLLEKVSGLFDFKICVLIIVQALATLYFSYFGFNYGKQLDYFDAKDKDLFYLYGIPRKIWGILIISYVPVAEFLSRMSIVLIYDFTNKITSNTFWKDTFSFSNFFSENSARGITGLVGYIFSICFAWAIAIGLFSFGLNAIKNKDTNYRWVKISFIFILISVSIPVIAIIRDRTWFF